MFKCNDAETAYDIYTILVSKSEIFYIRSEHVSLKWIILFLKMYDECKWRPTTAGFAELNGRDAELSGHP